MSPKYRQHGYLDDYDSDATRRRRPGEEDAGLSPLKILLCPRCGQRNKFVTEAKPDSECDRCRLSLHCCKVCESYAPGRRFDCAVPVIQEVERKEGRNECPRFTGKYLRDAARPMTAEDARKALDKFFKK